MKRAKKPSELGVISSSGTALTRAGSSELGSPHEGAEDGVQIQCHFSKTAEREAIQEKASLHMHVVARRTGGELWHVFIGIPEFPNPWRWLRAGAECRPACPRSDAVPLGSAVLLSCGFVPSGQDGRAPASCRAAWIYSLSSLDLQVAPCLSGFATVCPQRREEPQAPPLCRALQISTRTECFLVANICCNAVIWP